MKRVLCVYFPNAAISLFCRRHRRLPGHDALHEPQNGRPVLLCCEQAGEVAVARCCRLAELAGVHPGMTLAQARARVTRPQIAGYDAAQDEQALRKLAVWAQRFTPVTCVDPSPTQPHLPAAAPDGLLLDIGGCERLFGGEHGLAAQLAQELLRLGLPCRVAVAPNIAAAWAAARHAKTAITHLSADETPAALVDMPTAALRIGRDVQAALAELGVDCVGHVLQLSRATLAPRFEPQLRLRIKQLLGHVPELLEPYRPRPLPAVERVFDGPCSDPAGIEITLRELLEQLIARLQRGQSGVRQLELQAEMQDSKPHLQTLTLVRPSGNVRHVWSLLKGLAGQIPLENGVTSLRLTAALHMPMQPRQMVNMAISQDETDREQAIGELIDTLAQRLGVGSVCRLEELAHHVPEESYRYISIVDGTPSGSTCWQASNERPPLPSVLLDRPQLLEAVEVPPQSAPAQFQYEGAVHRIYRWLGPQRIVLPWWGKRAAGTNERDYFAVQDQDGCWMWVCKTADDEWYLHGVWA